MTKDQRDATLTVKGELRAAEAARDACIVATANLITSMIGNRQRAGLTYGEGQRVLEEAGRALANDIEGRRILVRTHAGLAGVARGRSLDWRMAGDQGDTEEQFWSGPTGAVAPQTTDVEA